MFRTYKALLRGTRIEWIDHPVIPAHPVPVHVTLLEEEATEAASTRGRGMAAALEALAAAGGLSVIPDPVRWQREQRQDRAPPGRED